jgi:hypothetical protein
MWLFVFRRLRMWLILVIVMPVLRTVIRRAAMRIRASNPDGHLARVLGRLDSEAGRPKAHRTQVRINR